MREPPMFKACDSRASADAPADAPAEKVADQAAGSQVDEVGNQDNKQL